MTGTVESRYLDTFNGILALERDKATVSRLTLRHTGSSQGEAGATKRPGRGGRERREEAERQKKPPVKTLSSGSLLKEYRVEKQRPATPPQNIVSTGLRSSFLRCHSPARRVL